VKGDETMEVNEVTLKAKDLNQQGVALAKAGNAEAAFEKFASAVDLDPMLIDSYKNYGDLYLKIGNYEEAKNYYKKALLIEKNGEIYFQLGNTYFLNDEVHLGLENYNLALSAGFDSDQMLFFMGLAYEHLNDDKMALRYVQKALFKNPSRPDYKVKKISIMLRLGMYDDAMAETDELLLNDPELYDGYHIKTTLLLENKEYEQAVKFAKSASDRFPEDADLMYDYAKTLALTAKLDDAKKVITNAKAMKYYESSKPKFTLLSAQVLAEDGDIDGAIKECDECISLEDGELFDEARFMRINLALTKPDFETALEQATAIINSDIRNSYYYAALYFRPFCQNKMGKVDEAKVNYNEAISIYRLATLQNPSLIEAYMYRVMCLKDLEKYDDALELLEFIENLNNEIPNVYTLRADIYNLTDRKALAKEELEKAYNIKPELRETLKIKEDGEY
jgi:tetratricopeptide (TPR) repeat protein